MKILVLGGTGRTGLKIIEEALNRGHVVHALVRDNKKLATHPNLYVFTGSPQNPVDMEKALIGCDTVVSALNISRNSDFPWAKLRAPQDLITQTISNVISLAGREKIKHIIVVSAWGAGESKNELPFFLRWLFYHTNLKYAFREHENQEKLLRKSELPWTAVRPVGLINSEKETKVKVSFNGKPRPGMVISRKAVARFILDIMEDKEYINRTPVISGA